MAMTYTDSCIMCTNMHTSCHGVGLVGGWYDDLVLRQVALDLPLAHAADVLLPFLALGFDEPLVNVRAQSARDHVVLVEHVQRLVQVPRQLVDPVLAPFAEAHGEDVLVDR